MSAPHVGLPSNPRAGLPRDPNDVVRPPPRQRSLGAQLNASTPNLHAHPGREQPPPLPEGSVDDLAVGMGNMRMDSVRNNGGRAGAGGLDRNGTMSSNGGYSDVMDDYYGPDDSGAGQDPYRPSTTPSPYPQHPQQHPRGPQYGQHPYPHPQDPYSQSQPQHYPPQHYSPQDPYSQVPYRSDSQHGHSPQGSRNSDPYAPSPPNLHVQPPVNDPYYDPHAQQQFLQQDPYRSASPYPQGGPGGGYYGDPYAQGGGGGGGGYYDPNGQYGYPDPNSFQQPPYGAPGPSSLTSAALSQHTFASGGSMYGGGSGAPSISGRSMASQRRPVNFAPTERGGGTRGDGTPITKEAIDDYRNRIKNDTDPETQFIFAKYLIEAAKQLSRNIKPGQGDEKMLKKYRDSLLQESLKLVKRLATQGTGLGKPAFAEAQFFLANCLSHGTLGLQVDHEKAYNLYVQASKQNHPSATYRTAVCNELGAGTRRDLNRAVLFYRKASALGDTAGMYKLGIILLNGLLGQKPNPKDAVGWLKRAASQADEDTPHALHELGLLFEQRTDPTLAGSGVIQDEAQARELFTQAAQLGHAPSQNRLGQAYEYGNLTCPVDPRRSIAWYTRAAERGDKESELALSGWYLTGSEGVLKQSDTEAYLWARRAANKGLPKAEYAVGYYSEVGIGVKQDVDEAKKWYMRAAAQGNKRAMQRLTELKKIESQPKKKGQKPQQQQLSRPTRQQAESECVIS
ncbi:HCP-like protein [Atractiella rhizophila]|nr:HCP-like protein [Atractiella rhizophila]